MAIDDEEPMLVNSTSLKEGMVNAEVDPSSDGLVCIDSNGWHKMSGIFRAEANVPRQGAWDIYSAHEVSRGSIANLQIHPRHGIVGVRQVADRQEKSKVTCGAAIAIEASRERNG